MLISLSSWEVQGCFCQVNISCFYILKDEKKRLIFLKSLDIYLPLPFFSYCHFWCLFGEAARAASHCVCVECLVFLCQLIFWRTAKWHWLCLSHSRHISYLLTHGEWLTYTNIKTILTEPRAWCKERGEIYIYPISLSSIYVSIWKQNVFYRCESLWGKGFHLW